MQQPLVGLPIQFHAGDKCIPATISATGVGLNISLQYIVPASGFSLGPDLVIKHNIPHISQLAPDQKTDFWCGIGEIERRATEAPTGE